jgi:glycosyltransferase involved in cell wall biosynthesis
VAERIGRARATIYVSEAEGYGLPPVESLAVGVPVIVSASCPSVAMLEPSGMRRLDPVTPQAIAAAVLALEDDAVAAALWREGEMLKFGTWRDFAWMAAAWLDNDA